MAARVMQLVHGDLLLDPSFVGISEMQRAEITQDFARARQHIVLNLRLKLTMWRRLPWVIFGVAHADVAKARSCGRRALSLWESAHIEVRRLPLVHKVCSPGSMGRVELEEFLAGVPLDDLPFLSGVVARCYFTPVVERSVERLHAIAKRHIGKAVFSSPVHMHFQSVVRCVSDMVEADPRRLHRLSACCGPMRNPSMVIENMGLAEHPVIREILDQQGGMKTELSRTHRRNVIDVLYHCDPVTLFRQMPLVQPQPPPPPELPPQPSTRPPQLRPPRPSPDCGAPGDDHTSGPPPSSSPLCQPSEAVGHALALSTGDVPSRAATSDEVALSSTCTAISDLWVKYALQHVLQAFEDKRNVIFLSDPSWPLLPTRCSLLAWSTC